MATNLPLAVEKGEDFVLRVYLQDVNGAYMTSVSGFTFAAKVFDGTTANPESATTLFSVANSGLPSGTAAVNGETRAYVDLTFSTANSNTMVFGTPYRYQLRGLWSSDTKSMVILEGAIKVKGVN